VSTMESVVLRKELVLVHWAWPWLALADQQQQQSHSRSRAGSGHLVTMPDEGDGWLVGECDCRLAQHC
jgi:hypothetical protein